MSAPTISTEGCGSCSSRGTGDGARCAPGRRVRRVVDSRQRTRRRARGTAAPRPERPGGLPSDQRRPRRDLVRRREDEHASCRALARARPGRGVARGGMRAWSLAWNSAEVPCPGSTAQIVQLRRTGKGCLSYFIGSQEMPSSSMPRSIPGCTVGGRRAWLAHPHGPRNARARRPLVTRPGLAVDTGARLCLPTTDRVSFEFAP